MLQICFASVGLNSESYGASEMDRALQVLTQTSFGRAIPAMASMFVSSLVPAPNRDTPPKRAQPSAGNFRHQFSFWPAVFLL